MGQVLHGSATTTHAIRAAIQRSKAPLKDLAAHHGLNQKTVAKWRKRAFVVIRNWLFNFDLLEKSWDEPAT